jgi:hypothetical protein
VFRSLVVVALVIALVGLIFAPPIVPENRRTATFYAFLVIAIVSALGVVQVLRGRIELRDREIRVVGLVGHRDYARDRIVDVGWAKGSPVVLRFDDGTRAALPDTGHSSTRVAGAIRAWLNEGRERPTIPASD